MRRNRLWVSVLAIAFSAPAIGADTRTSVDLRVSVGDAPPPPVVLVREEPRVVVVPGSTVYVVEDHRIGWDMFHYGVYWYAYNDGYWYRARSHRGPFRVVAVRYVPRPIFYVPERHWKRHPHGGPPGQMKKQGVVMVKEKGEKGRGRHR